MVKVRISFFLMLLVFQQNNTFQQDSNFLYYNYL